MSCGWRSAGPVRVRSPAGGIYVGAYPSGTALAVGLGWTLCLVVAGALRPRWRPWLVALAAVVISVHAVVRAVTQKHWITDILGSYLLVAGAFLLAAASIPGGGGTVDERPTTGRPAGSEPG
jgi:membrane-associated phospholipid phosphatase